MKIYFAGAENNLKLFRKLKIDNLLIAYPFIKKKITNINKKWFIDSGAYSAYTRNINIDIDKYINFILKNKLKQFASLDVIGNPKASYKNYLYMKNKKIKNQIPSFHYGEDLKYLIRYLEENSYIAIGGLVPLKNDKTKMHNFLNNCFNVICKFRDVKIHGYGVNNWEILKKYPFYSVDATSWLNPNIYGQHFKFSNGKLKRIPHTKPATNRFYDSEKKLEASLKEFLKAEKYLTKLWEKRGVIWND
tara:strand:+ start:5816 stop:6556 length:741 start_codon:yes stop_codon:yes gene_type:complete